MPEQQIETPAPVAVQTPQVKNNSKKNILRIVIVLLIILVPLAAITATAGAAAYNRGRNNSFSKLSAYLPTEKLPLLSTVGKSDSEMLRDAISSQYDLELSKKLGGRENKSQVSVDFAGNDSEKRSVNGSIQAGLNSAVNKTADKGKFDFTLSGNIKSGIINVDLGNEGFKANVLMPNSNSLYLSMNLSKQLIDTIKPELEKQGLESSDYNLDSITGKIYKLDINEYYKEIQSAMGPNSAPEYDSKKNEEATRFLINKLTPDFKNLYNKTFGDFEKYSTLKDEGRKTVAGQNAVVMSIVLKEDKVADVYVDFLDGISNILKTHKSDLITYCTSSGAFPAESCTEESIKVITDESISDNDRKDMRNSINEMFQTVEFQTLRFYVSAVDSTLLKTDLKMAVKQKGLDAISTDASGGKLTKFEVSISDEEVSRGKDVNVVEPKDYIDLNKLIKDQLNSYQNQLNTPITTPEYDFGV